MKIKHTFAGLLAFTLLVLLAAPYRVAAQTGMTTKTFEVTITNITNSKQALSPPLVAAHPAGVHAWQMGQLASPGLALLAREGMSDKLAAELTGKVTDMAAAHAHLLPGDNITLRINAHEGDVLSAASMLIETNDGFTGLDGVPLKDGASIDTMAYDAGAEDNTELAVDVPGPPFGGKNHGPDTNPPQPISIHPGISGKADVTTDFNWSGPVARFTVHEVDPNAALAPGLTAYDVSVANINNSKQALSPLVIATHPASVHAWQMGQLASKGLALLAREGMPDMLASEVKGVATDVQTTHAHLLPGDNITVRITAHQGDVLSAASMLIETNDGFTGLDGVPLTAGSTDAVAYDAGVEDNTELAVDVPGPPFGGKNHGPDTNPPQPISMHPGISGKADVTPDFNWSGAVARFTIAAVPASAGMSTGTSANSSGANMSGSSNMPAPTSPSTMPNTNTSTSAMPGMPDTGAADNIVWLAALLAVALAVFGLTLRILAPGRRR